MPVVCVTQSLMLLNSSSPFAWLEDLYIRILVEV